MKNTVIQTHDSYRKTALMQGINIDNGTLQELTTILKMVYTPDTLNKYAQVQNSFIKSMGKDLCQASPIDVLGYINGLEEKGEASCTIARKIYSLSKQFSLLVLVGHRKDNPVKYLQSIKKTIIPKQIKRVHQTLIERDIVCIQKLKGNKTALLIELLYSTGGRISEILAIKKRDIKPHDKIVSKVVVVGKGNKSRTLFIENTLIESIQKLFTVESEYLIHTRNGTQTSRINEYVKIKTLIKKVTGKEAHPHQLRHLYATAQILERKQSVKAVSRYLGHRTTAITQDMYVDDELTSEKAVLKTGG